MLKEENTDILKGIYTVYCGILQNQCGTDKSLLPSEDFFVAEQTERERICDVQKLLLIKEKKQFLIESFWNLLGTAPNDEMIKSAENDTSELLKYQRDLIYSILHSQQFKQNDITAINNPWEGKPTARQWIREELKRIYTRMPDDLQARIRKEYQKLRR